MWRQKLYNHPISCDFKCTPSPLNWFMFYDRENISSCKNLLRKARIKDLQSVWRVISSRNEIQKYSKSGRARKIPITAQNLEKFFQERNFHIFSFSPIGRCSSETSISPRAHILLQCKQSVIFLQKAEHNNDSSIRRKIVFSDH